MYQIHECGCVIGRHLLAKPPKLLAHKQSDSPCCYVNIIERKSEAKTKRTCMLRPVENHIIHDGYISSLYIQCVPGTIFNTHAESLGMSVVHEYHYFLCCDYSDC